VSQSNSAEFITNLLGSAK